MGNFNESKEQRRKQNIGFGILLMVMLLSIIVILIAAFKIFFSGPNITEENGTYTFENVAKGYNGYKKHYTFKVGKDIPSGYYSITSSTKEHLDNLDINIYYPEEFSEKKFTNLEDTFNYNMDDYRYDIINYDDEYNTEIGLDYDDNNTYVDNIFLPEEATIILNAHKNQNVLFKLSKEPNKLDLQDTSKKGLYETTDKTIEIPLYIFDHNLSVLNSYEIDTFSKDKIISYDCRREICNYKEYDLNNKEKKTREVVLEDELGKSSKKLTIDLLDKSFIEIF